MTAIDGKRKIDVRPWNVKPGDIIRYWPGTDPNEWEYVTVTSVWPDRNVFSGERCWRIYLDRTSYLDRRVYLTEYRTEYGMPVRVTVWRD